MQEKPAKRGTAAKEKVAGTPSTSTPNPKRGKLQDALRKELFGEKGAEASPASGPLRRADTASTLSSLPLGGGTCFEIHDYILYIIYYIL